MNIPLMPYVIGVPVETAAFYGREDAIAWLASELKDASTHSLLLVGSRASGKTSLLRHLQTILAADGYFPIYHDLVERPLKELLDDLAQQIIEEADLELPLPESPNAFRSQFLPDVQRALGTTQRLVLLLDNMDNLPGDHPFWTVVPILSGELPPVLIFTSRDLPNRLPVKLRTLLKTMPMYRLQPLQDEAAMALLYQGEERLDFDETAAARILDWSGGHPYLLQLVGRYFWEAASAPTTIGREAVETAITSLVAEATDDLALFWDDLDLAERLYTAVLAQTYEPFAQINAEDVIAAVNAQAFRLRPHKASWSADDLLERGLLHMVPNGQYSLSLPLFHAWVKQYRPVPLVKAQLDQLLNPEADIVFQQGQIYAEQGQPQKAVSHFRQVIADNPYHVGAQLALGVSLLTLGFTDTAVKRLERAHKLDAADAAPALAEALTAVAEAHLKDNARREALDACEQFNALDLHNPELQKRIWAVETAVWNQRGDIALERGFIDKALTAYENAGNNAKIAQLRSHQTPAEPTEALEAEAKAFMEVEAWSEAVVGYEKLLAMAQDTVRRAAYQKALVQCLEEVELAQYFDEGTKALENKNWLLARMSFMHVITRRMNYTRQGERALMLLDQAAKGHSFTSALGSTPTAPDGYMTTPPPERAPEDEPTRQTKVTRIVPELPAVPNGPQPGRQQAAGGKITTEVVNQIGSLERLGKGAIVKMVYSPDGKILALATALGIYFYDAQTLKESLFIETKIPVQTLAFSANGKMIATGSWHEKVQLWWVIDGQLISELEAHHASVQAVAFSPDGRWLVSADEEGMMAIWRTDDGGLLRIWEAHRGPITAVSFAPDSKMILSSSLDKTVCLWSLEGNAPLMLLPKHEDAVTQAIFSHDGSRFFSASRDRTAVLWRLDTSGWLRLRRQEVQASMLYSLTSHRQAVNDIAISPDNKWVATASSDHIVRLWNADNGTLLHEFKGHVSPVIAVAFSPDGRMLASATESLIQFWEVETRYSGQAIEGHMGALQSVAVSADGRLLATAVDTRILVWSLEDQTLRHILLGHADLVYHITFSPQGNMLASASADRTARLWNVTTGMATQTLSGHQGAVMDVSFSPNGQLLATASEAQTIRLWRTTDGKLLQTLTGHQDAVTTVCFNSNGRLLASASSDQSVRLWAIPEGRLQQTLAGHNGIIWQVSFSPDDRFLATAALDRTVRIWRAADGMLLHILSAHDGPVWSVAFSPNGELLLSGASDGKVRLWHVPDGALLRSFEGHTAPVSSVAFTPDGEQIISASADGTVRVRGIVA